MWLIPNGFDGVIDGGSGMPAAYLATPAGAGNFLIHL
jgi:hypothetical protein